jgi:hypothetical protein
MRQGAGYINHAWLALVPPSVAKTATATALACSRHSPNSGAVLATTTVAASRTVLESSPIGVAGVKPFVAPAHHLDADRAGMSDPWAKVAAVGEADLHKWPARA